MHSLKPISKESIPRALLKAERYRLLNEPREAESICQDILAADPQNQEALVCLVLSMTDLFEGKRGNVQEVRSLVDSLRDSYNRVYYAGVVEERWAKALLQDHQAVSTVYHALIEAMDLFEKADGMAPTDNDDAVLRWNTCVRLLERLNYTPTPKAQSEHEIFDEDVPLR